MITEWKFSTIYQFIKPIFQVYSSYFISYILITNKSKVKNCFWRNFWSWLSFFSLLWSTLFCIFCFDIIDISCWLFLFVLIISELIDPDTFPWVWYQIVCGPYSNRTYGFSYLAWSRKFVARVTVGCSYLLTSIYIFDWT